MTTWYQIENPVVIIATGKHAERYLNARLTAKIPALKEGESTLGAALSPQGKTEALFTIYRSKEETDTFILYSDGGDPETILAALARFKVADMVEFEDLSEKAKVLHTSDESLPEFGTKIKRKRGPKPGTDLLLLDEEEVNDPIQSKEKYKYFRLSGGTPAFPEEVTDAIFFPEADGLLSAISYNKGCYAGQETVERVSAIGKLPAKFLSLRIDQYIEDCPTEVTVDKEQIGEVISWASDRQQDDTFLICRIKKYDTLSQKKIEIGEYSAVLVNHDE